jgi:hypothetical protein
MERRDGEGRSGCDWGESRAARPNEEQAKRIKQLERALGHSQLQIEILNNLLGE